MLPVLQAQTAISRINEMAIAFGSMKEDKSQEYTFKLQQMATKSEGQETRAYRPKSPEEMAKLLGAGTKVLA